MRHVEVVERMKLTTLPKASKETGFPYAELLKLAKAKQIATVKPEGRRSWLIDIDDVLAHIQALKSGSVDGSESEIERPQVAMSQQSLHAPISRINSLKYEWMQKFTGKRRACS